MKKILNKIWKGTQTVWKFFNGKKTNIGAMFLLSAEIVPAFWPSLLSGPQVDVLSTIGSFLVGGGLFHQAAKNKTVNNTVNKTVGSVNKMFKIKKDGN